MLHKNEAAIKNEQSTDTGNTEPRQAKQECTTYKTKLTT